MAYVIAAAMDRARIRAMFFGILTFCAFGGVVAVLWQGGRLVLEGALTAGALVSFMEPSLNAIIFSNRWIGPQPTG